MQTMTMDGHTLFFGAEDSESVDLVGQACRKTKRLIKDRLGIDTPKDCRVYIMTSWLDFMFRSAPWPWKILMAVTIPLWAHRARKIWPLAGGWEQRYGWRRTIGVKPPRLLRVADRRIGDRIFKKRDDPAVKVQNITCHELTHAYTSHLRLPTWLNEGLAMVMADWYFAEPTVRLDTLDVLESAPVKNSRAVRRRLRVDNEDAMVYQYVRGYWITRYLEETHPGLLKELLSRRRRHAELEGEIAHAYNKSLDEFWCEIDIELVSHFDRPNDAA